MYQYILPDYLCRWNAK